MIMNENKSDASTSTEDIKVPPLRVYYFTHPFGVLSPEPPTLLHMGPTAPHSCWSSSPEREYDTTSFSPPRCHVVAGLSSQHSESSLSRDTWFRSSSSRSTRQYDGRLVPYSKLLPPLRMARTLPSYDCIQDASPLKCMNPGKLSLPPIALQARALPPCPTEVSSELASSWFGNRGPRRRLGVLRRRSRLGDVRRTVTCLLKRAVRGGSGAGSAGASPELRLALQTLRDAWPEQYQRRATKSRPLNVCNRNGGLWEAGKRETCDNTMVSQGLPVGGADSSPGLMRRRYSVPETIMRRYRVVQQLSESADQSGITSRDLCRPAPQTSPSTRDYESIRKSALLRRLEGRSLNCCQCCRQDTYHTQYSRSLDSTPANLSASTNRSHVHIPVFSSGKTSPAAETVWVPVSEKSAPSSCISILPSAKSATNPNAESSGSHHSDNYQLCKVASESKLCPSSKPPPSFEMLEIIVAESSDSRVQTESGSSQQGWESCNVSIDDYVSSVLLESLSSLTDRLELVTSRVPGDGKMSVIQKEIKVKLQSTGVNTIVHLSPTSNNQIIFGNEELFNDSEKCCDELCETHCIRDEPPDIESDEAVVHSYPLPQIGASETIGRNEDVNRAVLRQIQKLFHDEMQNIDPEGGQVTRKAPTVSHIELSKISNVNFFFEDDSEACSSRATLEADPGSLEAYAQHIELSGVGAGNYYEPTEIGALVQRFTALPHTASMEVNTSAAETAPAGSECTSLVDSLDDPNSPRSDLLRRARAGRRAELVRSAVDVLDLLPVTFAENQNVHLKESEYFFVKIEDSNCRCDAENINVADRMPEIIKQRLFRRHLRRQLRMESARRNKARNNERVVHKHEVDDTRNGKDLENDCRAIVKALIDDVISKIVQDEQNRTPITCRPGRTAASRSEDNSYKKNRRKPLHFVRVPTTGPTSTRASVGPSNHHYKNDKSKTHKGQRINRNKLSLLTCPALPVKETRLRRSYQKSELRDGNKCIEILEILEDTNSDKSSPDTLAQSESQAPGTKQSRKSRIPVPVGEKSQRHLRNSFKSIIGDHSPLLSTRCNIQSEVSPSIPTPPSRTPLSVPLPFAAEPTVHSSSVLFQRVFDVIPEERSSLSIESPAEDADEPSKELAFHVAAVSSPATRSVATSPLVVQPSDWLRVKMNKGGRRKMHRWSAQSEEGAQETTETIKIKSGQSAPVLDPRSNRKPKHVQPLATSREPHINLNRSASSCGRRPPSLSYPLSGPENASRNRKDTLSSKTQQSRSDEELSGFDCEEWSSSEELELCPPDPRWLAVPAQRRRPRQPPAQAQSRDPGKWSVTVAGSCRATLPADVEMRLRFPRRSPRRSPRRTPCRGHCYKSHCTTASQQDCQCAQRSDCMYSACSEHSASPRPRRAPPLLPAPRRPAVTLTVKKEAQNSSVLASKITRKPTDPLPDLETYSSSRKKTKRSVKMRQGCSLQCWLPNVPLRPSEALAVSGSAIVPERKPRAPSMSERDLTRLHTPRCSRRLQCSTYTQHLRPSICGCSEQNINE